MQSMVEGPLCEKMPSTALRAVPSPAKAGEDLHLFCTGIRLSFGAFLAEDMRVFR